MSGAESLLCSASAVNAGEPLAGTAPEAVGWLAIEQHGPFGRDALTQSHFPRELAGRLLALLDGSGIRPALIRPVGRHADRHGTTPSRRVYLASSKPGNVGLVSTEFQDPTKLLDLDLDAFRAGDLANALPGTTAHDNPVLLVCSHSKRDVCCALKGRPLASALAADTRYRGLVWETSHLGGHRFAPTAVQLPHGWVHGRLDVDSATAVLDAALRPCPEVPLGMARGRSAFPAAAQAADLAVRSAMNISGIDATDVSHRDGDTWDVCVENTVAAVVSVASVDLATSRLESCGRQPTIGRVFKTTIL